MGETIQVTNFSQDFLRKKVTITSDSLPTDFDLRIESKIVPKFNLEVKCGFELGFLEKGNINVTKNDSTTILNDNEIEGLSDINTGTIIMNNGDFVDLKFWNTDGGTYTIIVMIFINSTSDGTFVDSLSLLEATTKTETIIDEANLVSDGIITKDFAMNGYKGIILTLGVNNGLPAGTEVIENLSGWGTPENILNRDNTGFSENGITSDEEIILDCKEELTKEIVMGGFETGTGTGHYEIETSTDNITYTPRVVSPALSGATRTYFTIGSEVTFRYIKVIAGVDSGSCNFRGTIGLKGFIGTEVTLKIQTSNDSGVTWSDYITSTEFDTVLDTNDNTDEVFTITRENPSTTNTIYVFPQGVNKLRFHITLNLYASSTDTSNITGYGGKVSIEKVN